MAQDRNGKLEFPFDVRLAPAATFEVAPGVHWVRMPLPFRLDHINLYLLEDGDGWLMVDVGYGNDEVRRLWRQVWDATLGGRPITRIVITHFHPDHMGNAGWLAETLGVFPHMTYSEWLNGSLAAHLLGSANIEARKECYARHGIPAALARRFGTGHIPYSKGVTVPKEYYCIADGEVLEIGGRQWQVLVGRGHSPEHACLYCQADGLLLAGDQLLPNISPNVSAVPQEPLGDPLRHFLESLSRFKALVPADILVLPAHGRPFLGAHERIDWLHRHHDERLALIMDNVNGETTAGDMISVMFPVDEIDGHQMGFAMGESIAHLNRLMHAGRLERVDKGGIISYAKT